MFHFQRINRNGGTGIGNTSNHQHHATYMSGVKSIWIAFYFLLYIGVGLLKKSSPLFSRIVKSLMQNEAFASQDFNKFAHLKKHFLDSGRYILIFPLLRLWISWAYWIAILWPQENHLCEIWAYLETSYVTPSWKLILVDSRFPKSSF